ACLPVVPDRHNRATHATCAPIALVANLDAVECVQPTFAHDTDGVERIDTLVGAECGERGARVAGAARGKLSVRGAHRLSPVSHRPAAAAPSACAGRAATTRGRRRPAARTAPPRAARCARRTAADRARTRPSGRPGRTW